MTHLVTTHIALWCLGVSVSSYHELFPTCEAIYSVMTHIALSLEYPHTHSFTYSLSLVFSRTLSLSIHTLFHVLSLSRVWVFEVLFYVLSLSLSRESSMSRERVPERVCV